MAPFGFAVFDTLIAKSGANIDIFSNSQNPLGEKL
jgi:hypothetical protein